MVAIEMNPANQENETIAGVDAVIEAYKKGVDVTLIRENLRSQ